MHLMHVSNLGDKFNWVSFSNYYQAYFGAKLVFSINSFANTRILQKMVSWYARAYAAVLAGPGRVALASCLL